MEAQNQKADGALNRNQSVFIVRFSVESICKKSRRNFGLFFNGFRQSGGIWGLDKRLRAVGASSVFGRRASDCGRHESKRSSRSLSGKSTRRLAPQSWMYSHFSSTAERFIFSANTRRSRILRRTGR